MKRTLAVLAFVVFATPALAAHIAVDSTYSSSTDPCPCGDNSCSDGSIPSVAAEIIINNQMKVWLHIRKNKEPTAACGGVGAAITTYSCRETETYKDRVTLQSVQTSSSISFTPGSLWTILYSGAPGSGLCDAITHYYTLLGKSDTSTMLQDWADSSETELTVYLGQFTNGRLVYSSECCASCCPHEVILQSIEYYIPSGAFRVAYWANEKTTQGNAPTGCNPECELEDP